MKIEDVDKNFKTKSVSDDDNLIYINCLNKPLKIYGLLPTEDSESCFFRIPKHIAQKVSVGVDTLNSHTAGGRIRFKTDSETISIKVSFASVGKLPHMAMTGSSGFDLYEKNGKKESFVGTFIPPFNVTDEFTAIVKRTNSENRELTVNMPLYSGIKSLYLGFEKGSTISEASEYGISAPVVYYGSSITQGGCASRPGNSYQAIVSRELDCDFINLGFAGNAKGESEIAEYIASLNMSAFILDYDHNSPNIEHLQKTHENFFLNIRNKNQELPIIIISRPKLTLNNDEIKRKDIIKATFKNAVQNGDSNAYFIDGNKIFDIFGKDNCTVDNCHPNDLGFMCFAQALIPQLKKIFKM